VVLVLWLALPGELECQSAKTDSIASVTLDGVVRDTLGVPVAGADVVVDATHRDLTNVRGEFSISGLMPGRINLVARRLGYTPIVTTVQADPGLIVHLAIRLVPASTQLSPVVVKGSRLDRALEENGFYERQKLGFGHYFDSEYLSHHQGDISRVVGMVPSVSIARSRTGETSAILRRGMRTCRLSLFIDGVYTRAMTAVGIDGAANRDDVAAVEVYTQGIDIPMEYLGKGGSSTECGAILIWTKFAPARSR
jgi:hypothetical protein